MKKEKKTVDIIRKIISLFIHNDMPEEAYRKFSSWMLEGGREKENALEEEWNDFLHDESFRGIDMAHLRRLSDIKHGRRRFSGGGRKGIFIRLPYVAACAAFILMVFAGHHLYMSRNENSMTCLVASSEGKSSFRLPDGSHVWLNSNARLGYGNGMGVSGDRAVRLDGEAFFEVVKSERPFVVELDDKVRIKVLGTSFNVRNTPLWNEYEITLSSGKVQIMSEGMDDIFLKPGQQCILSKSSPSAIVRSVDVSDCISWTEDVLEFENNTLEEIAMNLEHRYNVRVLFEDGVDRNVRLSFKLKRESLDEIFGLIGQLASVRCVISEEGIVTVGNQY